MSTSVSHTNVHSDVKFRKKLKKNELRRLILIDGFNVMHHFKDMGLENSSVADEKMSPLILLPLVCDLIKEEFLVRIVLKNIPPENRITDLHILGELQRAGLCIFGLHTDVEEEDDLVMLRIAKEYGALIISRDHFRNHKEYEEIARNNVIEYDKVPTGLFKDKNSVKKLCDALSYKYGITLHETPEKFIVDPANEDYELVQKSYTKFEKLKYNDFVTLKVLHLYTHAYFCYIYNLGIPREVKNFIFPTSFPMLFKDFDSAYNARQIYEMKNRIYVRKTIERDDISDDGLNYELNDDDDV